MTSSIRGNWVLVNTLYFVIYRYFDLRGFFPEQVLLIYKKGRGVTVVLMQAAFGTIERDWRN